MKREKKLPPAAVETRRTWKTPKVTVLKLDKTRGGAAPKNNENPNFFLPS